MSGFNLTVRRWQPGGEAPRDDQFTLTGLESEKLLELIRRLQREADATIPYRAACCTGKCGTCTLQVNGRPCLSCQTMLEPGAYVIEPPKGWIAVRDLVAVKAPAGKGGR